MTGMDRTLIAHDDTPRTVTGRRPNECSEPTCWREPYIDGVCKAHHDLEVHRQESHRRRKPAA